jgi:hypothetical protein
MKWVWGMFQGKPGVSNIILPMATKCLLSIKFTPYHHKTGGLPEKFCPFLVLRQPHIHDNPETGILQDAYLVFTAPPAVPSCPPPS